MPVVCSENIAEPWILLPADAWLQEHLLCDHTQTGTSAPCKHVGPRGGKHSIAFSDTRVKTFPSPMMRWSTCSGQACATSGLWRSDRLCDRLCLKGFLGRRNCRCYIILVSQIQPQPEVGHPYIDKFTHKCCTNSKLCKNASEQSYGFCSCFLQWSTSKSSVFCSKCFDNQCLQ